MMGYIAVTFLDYISTLRPSVGLGYLGDFSIGLVS